MAGPPPLPEGFEYETPQAPTRDPAVLGGDPQVRLPQPDPDAARRTAPAVIGGDPGTTPDVPAAPPGTPAPAVIGGGQVPVTGPGSPAPTPDVPTTDQPSSVQLPAVTAPTAPQARQYDLSKFDDNQRQEIAREFVNGNYDVSLDRDTNKLTVTPRPGMPTPGDRRAQVRNDYARMLDEIDNDPYLRAHPDILQVVRREAREWATTQTALAAGTEANQAKQDRIDKDIAERAFSDYTTLIQNAVHDPTADMRALAAQINNDPRFAKFGEHKEHLLDRLDKFAGGDNDDLKRYGPGIWDYWQRVTAPPGDPHRITSMEEIYKAAAPPNRQLTIAGVDKLRDELNRAATPKSQAETDLQKIFLENAERQVSGELRVGGQLVRSDPKGKEQFLKFLNHFWPTYDAARAAGKTPEQLLDPDSKEYLGATIKNYQRDPQTWYNDLTAANPPGQPAAQQQTWTQWLFGSRPPAVAAPGLPTFDPESVRTPQELRAAVQDGRLARGVATDLALRRGWARPNPAPDTVTLPPLTAPQAQ